MTGPFDELTIRGRTVPNRLMLAPMCQYSAEDQDGLPTEWHHVHYGTRAVGGAGIVMTEATAVEPRGRITPWDLGIWTDEQAEAYRRTTDFIREQGSMPAIQLAHAGRKASTSRPWEGGDPIQPADGGWEVVGPSDTPWPYREAEAPPTSAMDEEDVDGVIEAFATGAERAVEAGFEIVEVHAAHGYLLHEFLSPVTNHREDAYGGDFEGRTRLVREITEAVRSAIGDEIPLFVRISATDWIDEEESWDLDQSIRLADRLYEAGADLIDTSTSGIRPGVKIPYTGPNFQVRFAEAIRQETETEVRTAAVGGIKTPEQVAAVLANDRADLVVVGREFLHDPYFPLHVAETLDEIDGFEPPLQYRRGF